MATKSRTLFDFLGTWSLDRQIFHADGTTAEFVGTAVWQSVGERVQYRETGDLMMGSHKPFSAEQKYWWYPDLAVHFDDGRYFHTVPPFGGDMAHWCAPDQYRGSYDFSGWPQFRVDWHVSGPKKNYRMVSFYNLLSGNVNSD